MLIKEVDKSVKELVDQNDGYCPCAVHKTPDTKCMCKEFREQTTPGLCHCGRFEKVENESLFTEYRDGKPVAYRYGEPWVALQLAMEGGYPTEQEAREAWEQYKEERAKNPINHTHD